MNEREKREVNDDYFCCRRNDKGKGEKEVEKRTSEL
jgi:hypothetical protein